MAQLRKTAKITGFNEFEKYTEAEKKINDLIELIECEIPVKNKLLNKLQELQGEIFEKRREYQQ